MRCLQSSCGRNYMVSGWLNKMALCFMRSPCARDLFSLKMANKRSGTEGLHLTCVKLAKLVHSHHKMGSKWFYKQCSLLCCTCYKHTCMFNAINLCYVMLCISRCSPRRHCCENWPGLGVKCHYYSLLTGLSSIFNDSSLQVRSPHREGIKHWVVNLCRFIRLF